MSADVEDKIVAMKFDNKQFEPAAKTTMSTLDRLKAALNFGGASKGMNDLQKTASKFSLGNLAQGAQGVSAKFVAMSAVAISAIGNIVTRAVDAGIRVAKAFTIDPLKAGFAEYETNLNSVQTILANTQASGSGLKEVNAALDELNTYSDKTIYNFSEMARNIGTFTAAGVDLKTSTAAIKGIANLAALSGSNSQQASSAMYQLSQAISSGRVGLQDWNSVVNAGMGGTVFQRALAQTAEKMGTLSKGSVELKGKMKNVSIEGKSFRESITAKPGEESWLTSKVLTQTLKQFTGDMSKAELAAQGFSKSQIKDILAQAKTAQDAATQVKTFSQLVGTLQESAGSGWAKTSQLIFGDFKEAKLLFTDINNVLGKMIGRSAKNRNKMIEDWKEADGRKNAIKALGNVFKIVMSIAVRVGKAFRQIFPPVTGKQLAKLTEQFLEFTKNMKPSILTLYNIRRTAAGFFAILSIGWSVVKGILGLLGKLFGFIGDGSGDFLNITGNVGDFLVHLDKVIKKGDLVNKFFDELGKYIMVPIQVLKEFGHIIAGIFSGFDEGISEAISSAFERIGQRLKPLISAGSALGKVWDFLSGVFSAVGRALAPVGKLIGTALAGIGDAIGKAFKAGDFNSVYDALNTGLLAGIVLLIKKFMDKGLDIDIGGGLLSGIKESFGALTGMLTAMQTQVQAKTIMTIAIAVGVLTASIIALSLINSEDLTRAIAAITAAFAQLLGAMAILNSISGSAGFTKIPLIAGSMIALSVAVLILAGAVAILAQLSWEDLAKGLSAVAILLALLVGVAKGLDKSGGSLVRAGLAMIPLAIGLKILASAVKDFAEMTWGDMAKGMAGVAAGLVIIGKGVSLMPKTMALQAVGLVIVAAALKILASALGDMGGMSWGEIAKSMVVLAGSLILLAAGMAAMTEGIAGAAALIVAAAALAILTPVLIAFGDMKWESIAKAMVVLFGALLLLAAGMAAMTEGIAGAAALLVVAYALAVLAPVLILLGTMSWESIAKGLAAIAGVFLILGLSSAILTPLIPVIIALGAALFLLGASVALVGIGLLAIATAFSIFAAAGTAGLLVLTGMISLIPFFLAKFAEGILAFATTLASHADKFVQAFASLLGSLLDAVIMILPKVGQTITVLVKTILDILIKNAPRIANAGVTLMIALARAIEGKVPTLTTLAGNIIVKFLTSMGKQVPKIAKTGTDLIIKLMKAIGDSQVRLLDQGAKLIISFVNKLASTIRARAPELRDAGVRLAGAIISGMTGGISDKAWEVAQKAASMVKDAIKAAKDALASRSPSKEFMKLGRYSAEGMALGIDKYAGLAGVSAANMSTTALSAVKQSMIDISNAAMDNIDFNPTIKPILDLSQITASAAKISGMLDQKAISADVSYRQALGVNRDLYANQSADNTPVNAGDTILKYEQTIIAPKQPSPVEIYRQTKNLLSISREALTNHAVS